MLSGAAAVAALDSSASELGQVLAIHRASGVEAPEQLTVAVGDRRLLALHRAVTGRDVEVVAACPECASVSMAELSCESLPAATPRSARLEGGGGLRQPTYGDLVGLPEGADGEDELVRRCVVGRPARAPGPEDLEQIDDSLAGPLVMTCPDCGAGIEVAADAERLALEGLDRHVAEIDREIHLLARAYGWPLPAIEALPDRRRHRFARLVEDGR